MLFHGSLLLKSLFISHGNENNQLLQYGHTYQLSICVGVKKMTDMHVHTAERCENGNVYTLKQNINFFIGCCDKQIQKDVKCLPPMLTNHPYTPLDLKCHACDTRYQATPFLACVEKILKPGDEDT